MMGVSQEMTAGSWNIPSGGGQVILGCLFHWEQAQPPEELRDKRSMAGRSGNNVGSRQSLIRGPVLHLAV